MKIEGNIDPTQGGVGVVEAIFNCPDYSIRAPIPFYNDTACSRTTLGHLDALNAKVPIDKLEISKQPVDTANGEVFPYIVHSCSIIFGQDPTSRTEYVGDIFISGPEQGDSMSALGLDVLYKYRISFDTKRKKVILEG